MVAKKSMKFHRMYLLKGRFINSYILFTVLRKVVSKEYMKAGKDAMYVKWTVTMRCADYEVDVTMDGEDHTPLALSVFVKTLLDSLHNKNMDKERPIPISALTALIC